jgi:hypothetical protein
MGTTTMMRKSSDNGNRATKVLTPELAKGLKAELDTQK